MRRRWQQHDFVDQRVRQQRQPDLYNPANGKVAITVGSKNFTEEYILGEIYAQGLEAAGYNVKKKLNLGSETIALKAIKDGQIAAIRSTRRPRSGSFFSVPANKIPANAQEAYTQAKTKLEKEGLTPSRRRRSPIRTPSARSPTAEKDGLTTISDLKGKSQNMVLAGSPECRERIDCLAGAGEELRADSSRSSRRWTSACATRCSTRATRDLSILFTSDAQLANSKKYTILKDDKGLIPAGQRDLHRQSKKVADEAGPDFAQDDREGAAEPDPAGDPGAQLRVDIDKKEPADVAHNYLVRAGTSSSGGLAVKRGLARTGAGAERPRAADGVRIGSPR